MGCSFNRRLVADVDIQRLNIIRVAAKAVTKSVEQALVNVPDRHAATDLQNATGNGMADNLATPGDDRCTAFKVIAVDECASVRKKRVSVQHPLRS